ncbi:Acetokinase family-domain-containing protein [Limtongia smithiae]|uniref:Acetokinase family-domain-containing protein n=1 Tax=Limtongia smithiae TaxID=1125753 RepID=UPI0034CE872D
MRVVLCMNAGSSSVKYSIYKYAPPIDGKLPMLLVTGAIAGLTSPKQYLTYKSFNLNGDGGILSFANHMELDCPDHDTAFKLILEHLLHRAPEKKVIDSVDDIYAVCHRIVHGGANPRPLVITKAVYSELDMLSDLAPLHNQRALDIVHSCLSRLANTKNVAFFDSSFHTSIPRHIYTYPISLEVQERHQLKKYGFHGLSYEFITQQSAAYLDIAENELNAIALHLGSGASACAIQNGHSLNTSMGLTPLEGLPGATRSGSVDPSLIFHYHSDSSRMSTAMSRDVHLTFAEDILNRQSGWFSITGTTDFGEITKKALEENDELCKLAFDIFANRVSMYIGQYWVALQGKASALVFAGGIGENGKELRSAVVQEVNCLGFEIDEKRNAAVLKSPDIVNEISPEGSKLKVLVVRTDEQVQMANHVIRKGV